MKQLVVIGAGVMGADIALLFAKAGYSVTVCEIRDENIERAKLKIRSTLNRMITKGHMTELEGKETFKQLSFTLQLEQAANADFILEAVRENADLKKSIFRELNTICKPECIFASNTSSVSITSMAMSSGRPDRFLGMHFFNPAITMKLVEIIRCLTTSEESYHEVLSLSHSIKKQVVTVQDSPGFVVNRLLIPMINNASSLLERGYASADDIDKAMCCGANHPMGPLRLADLIGLDVTLSILDIMYEETHHEKFCATELLRRMVRANKLGRKTGEGFFLYN